MNIDILGISELKWTGMGEFNSDDNYIYYCVNLIQMTIISTTVGNPHSQQKSLKHSTWMQSQK